MSLPKILSDHGPRAFAFLSDYETNGVIKSWQSEKALRDQQTFFCAAARFCFLQGFALNRSNLRSAQQGTSIDLSFAGSRDSSCRRRLTVLGRRACRATSSRRAAFATWLPAEVCGDFRFRAADNSSQARRTTVTTKLMRDRIIRI